ncbi:hypothetical protein, partial [Xenorhabdus entomophaga]|uniref:hypothetical protein n=1 Tax=Xenorhabdus entomophaga TaxID=3136257 RepID=UPI0030F4991C
KNLSKSNSIGGMRLSNCRFTSLDRSTIDAYVNGHLWWRGAKDKVTAPYNDSGRLKGEIFLNIYHHDNNGNRGGFFWTQKQFASLQYLINGQWVNVADDEYKITNLDTASNPPRGEGRSTSDGRY